MIVENGAHRAVGSSADLQSPAAGRIDPPAFKSFDETDNVQAGPVALFGMRPISQNALAKQCDVRSDCRCFTVDALDRPVGKATWEDGMCSGVVVCLPLPLERRWAAIRSPLWKISIVLAVIRASTCSRAKR